MKTFPLTAIAVVACGSLAAAFGPDQPIFSLAPTAKCDAKTKCFEGTKNALELAAKLNGGVPCKEALLREGGCALYAFPKSAGFLPLLPQVKLFTASAGPHLWFRYGGGARCGEVDAAPRMPKTLFEPNNAEALKLYIQVTEDTYFCTGGRNGGCDSRKKLVVGRCADEGSTVYNGVAQQVSWGGGILYGACASRCGCGINPKSGGGSKCPDLPDVPPFRFCSLCGPKYNAPINITLYTTPSPPPPAPTPAPPAPPQCNPVKGCNVCAACCEAYIPAGKSCSECVKQKCAAPTPPAGKTIVDVAIATPDLSTLVAAVKAGDLVGTLSSAGPFTVFGPTNEAFAALPAGTLDNLLKHKNQAELVDVLTYHVVAGNVQAKDLKDGQMLTTVEGKTLTVRIAGSTVLINSAKVVIADVEASNGVVHVVDGVLLPGAKLNASAI